MLVNDRDHKVLEAYRRAAKRFLDWIRENGLEDLMEDLMEAKGKWLSSERAEPVVKLLESSKSQQSAQSSWRAR